MDITAKKGDKISPFWLKKEQPEDDAHVGFPLDFHLELQEYIKTPF